MPASPVKNCTRRSFVAATGASLAAVAACAAPALAEEAPATTDAWDRESDVVIVGGGAAAFAAAVEAARAGAEVLLLEKSSAVGGDSALCDGILGAAGSRVTAQAGIDLTVDDAVAWYLENPAWYPARDPEVSRFNAEHSGETIDWLEDLGVEFEPEPAPRFGYTDEPFIHQVVGKGAAMMGVLGGVADAEGVEVLLDTPATGLVVNGDGRVVGVEALQGEKPLRVKAHRAVVLACGDESGSGQMLAALSPSNRCVFPGSHPACAGDGYAMAQRAGVFTTRLSETPQITTLAGMMVGNYVNVNYLGRLHGLWLDADARRFYNEEARYFDPMPHRAILAKANEQGFQPVLLLGDNPDVQALLEVQPLDGWAYAETLEELAPQVGLDPAALVETVERYNALCEQGCDVDFGRDPEYLLPMTGPFYAAAMYQSTSTTMGGVKIDTAARALRLLPAGGESMFEPVPGLYAAGLVCEWNAAIGGTVLSAMTMGRVAGANAAAEPAWE